MKTWLKKGSFKNTLESNFVKRSSNFGGSGVDFGRSFEGALGAENAWAPTITGHDFQSKIANQKWLSFVVLKNDYLR